MPFGPTIMSWEYLLTTVWGGDAINGATVTESAKYLAAIYMHTAETPLEPNKRTGLLKVVLWSGLVF